MYSTKAITIAAGNGGMPGIPDINLTLAALMKLKSPFTPMIAGILQNRECMIFSNIYAFTYDYFRVP